jgi:hypothetical protein
MSLMEFLEIRDGALVPAYRRQVESIRCDWCDFPAEPVLPIGSLWVCPACFGEAEREWGRGGGER